MAPEPTGADHDQIDVAKPRELEDLLGRIAFEHHGLGLDAGRVCDAERDRDRLVRLAQLGAERALVDGSPSIGSGAWRT